MKKIIKPLAIGAGLLSLTVTAQAKKQQELKKPNFLFLFADDQTVNSINALGNSEIHTPNLDRLVKNGVTFTHCFNQGAWNGAVSVASRTMILSGQYVFKAARNRKLLGWAGGAKEFSGNAKETNVQTWPQTLRKAGYTTFLTGKWHNSFSAALDGFEYAEAIGHGMYEQFDEKGNKASGYNRPTPENNSWKPYNKKLKGHWAPFVYDIVKKEDGTNKIGPKYTVEQHTSELYADKAIDFLQTRAKSITNPFFMYVAFNAPHDPRQSPKKYVDLYPESKVEVPKNFLPEHPFDQGHHKVRDEKLAPFPRTKEQVQVHRSEYYAIISHMDHEIGRILDALEKTGKLENTYIIFTADHGLAVGQHGLMGKQNQYDHSVRVPFIMCGPSIEKNTK
jgi:choline-sulfatase